MNKIAAAALICASIALIPAHAQTAPAEQGYAGPPTPAAAPKPAKDANAMIDAGAAKAKETAAKVAAWVAKKKAEHDAKKAAAANGGAPGVVTPKPAPAQ